MNPKYKKLLKKKYNRRANKNVPTKKIIKIRQIKSQMLTKARILRTISKLKLVSLTEISKNRIRMNHKLRNMIRRRRGKKTKLRRIID